MATYDVFISHASEDKDFAEPLYKALIIVSVLWLTHNNWHYLLALFENQCATIGVH